MGSHSGLLLRINPKKQLKAVLTTHTNRCGKQAIQQTDSDNYSQTRRKHSHAVCFSGVACVKSYSLLNNKRDHHLFNPIRFSKVTPIKKETTRFFNWVPNLCGEVGEVCLLGPASLRGCEMRLVVGAWEAAWGSLLLLDHPRQGTRVKSCCWGPAV